MAALILGLFSKTIIGSCKRLSKSKFKSKFLLNRNSRTGYMCTGTRSAGVEVAFKYEVTNAN